MEFIDGELATIGRLVSGAEDNRERIQAALEKIAGAEAALPETEGR